MCIERIKYVIEHRIHQCRVRACTYRAAHNQAIKAVDNRRRADFSTVRVISSSPGALNNELLFCHQSADDLLRNNPVVTEKHCMKASVAVTIVIHLKDISHEHTYFRILIPQALTGFVVKITAACKLQNAKQLSNGYFLLRASTIRVFSLFFSLRKLMPRSFFMSSFAFVSMSRSSCS